MELIGNNLNVVKENIKIACEKSKRQVNEVTLVAVTKTRPIEDIETILNLGIKDCGENKVQEINTKYDNLNKNITWHMIGHLQTNKVKYIINKVDLIHSVDSLKLAKKINEEAKKNNKTMDILVQINVAKEKSKYGFMPEEVNEIIKEISLLKNINIRGLMNIAPYTVNPEENRYIFKEMKHIFIDINSKNIDNVSMDILSMGMTNDYMIAIEEGATMIRVGTGIFKI